MSLCLSCAHIGLKAALTNRLYSTVAIVIWAHTGIPWYIAFSMRLEWFKTQVWLWRTSPWSVFRRTCHTTVSIISSGTAGAKTLHIFNEGVRSEEDTFNILHALLSQAAYTSCNRFMFLRKCFFLYTVLLEKEKKALLSEDVFFYSEHFAFRTFWVKKLVVWNNSSQTGWVN